MNSILKIIETIFQGIALILVAVGVMLMCPLTWVGLFVLGFVVGGCNGN